MEVATRVCGALVVLLLQCALVFSQASYDYSNGTKGPANWGNLNPPFWQMCKNGTKQSPINISTGDILLQQPKSLDLVYKTSPVDVEIYNDGHSPTVEIKNLSSGNLTISGVMYRLQSFHFHIPSEHLIRNMRYPMEMHLVHRSASNQVAVVGVLYRIGLQNEFLSQFFGKLPPFTPPNVRSPIKIRLPVIMKRPYYRYNGSLTTPPCDENVVWTVINEFPTLSTQQLQQLRTSLPEENARPVQPTNGRKVVLFP